jgi:hypothetical protein
VGKNENSNKKWEGENYEFMDDLGFMVARYIPSHKHRKSIPNYTTPFSMHQKPYFTPLVQGM